MSRNAKIKLGALVMFGALTFLFQNCGEGLVAIKQSSFGEENLFRKGDVFTTEKLPSSSRMLMGFIEEYGYNDSGSGSTKAIAIAQNGYGYASVGQGLNQTEESQIAILACNVLTGSPCALIAETNRFVVDARQLKDEPEKIFIVPKSPGAGLTLKKTPFIGETVEGMPAFLETYASKSGFKAIAVGIDGTISPAYTHDDDHIQSEEEAKRMALETCEMSSTVVPCLLFAVGNEVVFDWTNQLGKLSINYGKKTVATSIPGMTDEHFNDYTLNFWSKYPASQVAVYINIDGAAGYGADVAASVAQKEALDYCKNAADTSGSKESCFLYAFNSQIMMTASQIYAYRFSTKLHCHSIPRASCEEHAAVGCTDPGTYYISAGSETTESACFSE